MCPFESSVKLDAQTRIVHGSRANKMKAAMGDKVGAMGLKNVAGSERGQATDQEPTACQGSRGTTKETQTNQAAIPVVLSFFHKNGF